TDLFHELVATRPAGEDLVLTHGDYCLPNVILRGPTLGNPGLAGFVDVGRAGLADRYRDLALASRSIAANLGAAWVAPFFAHYGAGDGSRSDHTLEAQQGEWRLGLGRQAPQGAAFERQDVHAHRYAPRGPRHRDRRRTAARGIRHRRSGERGTQR